MENRMKVALIFEEGFGFPFGQYGTSHTSEFKDAAEQRSDYSISNELERLSGLNDEPSFMGGKVNKRVMDIQKKAFEIFGEVRGIYRDWKKHKISAINLVKEYGGLVNVSQRMLVDTIGANDRHIGYTGKLAPEFKPTQILLNTCLDKIDGYLNSIFGNDNDSTEEDFK